jgi:hypothetical protein
MTNCMRATRSLKRLGTTLIGTLLIAVLVSGCGSSQDEAFIKKCDDYHGLFTPMNNPADSYCDVPESKALFAFRKRAADYHPKIFDEF